MTRQKWLVCLIFVVLALIGPGAKEVWVLKWILMWELRYPFLHEAVIESNKNGVHWVIFFGWHLCLDFLFSAVRLFDNRNCIWLIKYPRRSLL